MIVGRLRGEVEGSAGWRKRLTMGKRCPEQLSTRGPAIKGDPTGHQAEWGGVGPGFRRPASGCQRRRGTAMVTCKLSPLVGKRGACDFLGGK